MAMVWVVYWLSTWGLIAEADRLGPKVGDVPSSSHKPRMFHKVQQLVPQFAPTCVMADFEEASVAGFQHIYPAAGVAGCWWHYTQAIIKIVHLWSGAALSGLKMSILPSRPDGQGHVSEHFGIEATGQYKYAAATVNLWQGERQKQCCQRRTRQRCTI